MHISFYIWTINDKYKQNQRLVEKHQLWQWFMCIYDAKLSLNYLYIQRLNDITIP